jgi:hypothetical protein
VSWAYVNTASGTANGSVVAAFDKATLYAGGTFTSGSTLGFINVAASSGYHFMPAATYDTNQPAVYLVRTASSTLLAVYSVTGSAGTPALTFRGNASGPAWHRGGQLNFGGQLGSSQQINLLDDRMGGQVVYREGLLWCAHTIWLPSGTPTRSAVQWWQLNTNGVSMQRGYIEDTTAKTNYAYPSIAVNRFRDVLIGFSSFATNQYASANYAFRACNDGVGTIQAPTLLKAGASPYWKNDGAGQNRWGDYSASQVDPVSDTDLWTIQEYARQYVGTLTNRSGRFGLWWGMVAPVLPGNDTFANSYVITGAEGSTNGTTVRATRQSGEPNHAGHTNSPSVWYHWVATTNGATTIAATNIGANIDTTVAIYTGSSVGGLTLVTNRHAVGGTNVIFNATAGTTYRIAIAGYNGTCGDFMLRWAAPTVPMILAQPQSTNCVANVNENALFAVVGIGTPTPAYQWRFKGTNSGATTTNISGATNTSYTITNVQTSHVGDYSVVLTNSAGSVTSSVAALFIYADSAARLNLYGYSSTSFWFQIYGLTNRAYVVQTSTNLNSSTNWNPIFTNFVSFFYTNFNRTNDPRRFYRAITNN